MSGREQVSLQYDVQLILSFRPAGSASAAANNIASEYVLNGSPEHFCIFRTSPQDTDISSLVILRYEMLPLLGLPQIFLSYLLLADTCPPPDLRECNLGQLHCGRDRQINNRQILEL